MFKIPSPEEVFKELGSILPLIYAALDYAILKTREFFEREDQEKHVNRGLAPNLVRYWAKQYLEIHGQEVKEEQEEGEDSNSGYLEKLPNNGLCLNVGRCRVRVLKSDDGELPIPGHSQSRQEFYSQPGLPFPEDDEEDGELPPLKLILLWDVTRSYNLKSLSLACPMSGDTTRVSVKAHWHKPIPDSFLGLGIQTESSPATEEEPKDLPLTQEEPRREDEQSEELG